MLFFCFYFSDHPEFEGTTADIINHLLYAEEQVSLIVDPWKREKEKNRQSILTGYTLPPPPPLPRMSNGQVLTFWQNEALICTLFISDVISARQKKMQLDWDF